MTQTLLSLLALMLTIPFVFNQQQHVLNMLRSAIGMQATSVAVDRLEETGTWAYDDNTKGGATVLDNNFPFIVDGSVYIKGNVEPGVVDYDGPADGNIAIYASQRIEVKGNPQVRGQLIAGTASMEV